MSDSRSEHTSFDAIVVGAGFAGLYTLYRLRELGFSARVLERGSQIGGTWYWNRYPGARCDVESLQYSYSFSDEVQQEWHWTERFASQPEILRYIDFVAEKFDLKRDIELNAGVKSAVFDETRERWTVTTEDGRQMDCRYVIFATGVLSVPVEPSIPGLDAFQGKVYRTSKWPEAAVDFAGRRVAVVGTGSSGIQVVPAVAQQAERLFVLQRTPNYSVPGYNAPMDPDFERDWKANYREHRQQAAATRNNNLFRPGTAAGRDTPPEEREREFEERWKTGGLGFTYAYPDLTLDEEVNRHASDFVRRKIAGKINDPEVAARLVPTEYGIGGRRLCVDNGYYETFNRENVTLVDLREQPLVSMTEHGFRTQAADYAIDDLVLATGFDAFTGALVRIDIRGRGGLPLKQKWSDGPANYLGLTVAGFPNMFMLAGPGSPSVLSNMVISIEQHVDWLAACLGYLKSRDNASIEARPEEEAKWVDHLISLAQKTLIFRTKSWYTGANVSGKDNSYFMYMGGTNNYVREITAAADASDYGGFIIK
ncbi:NAD(P)/FAD-dependent oxidoreductase [Aquibium sp. LZ166]|uniref:NAD(P)/FAD-dependent oxidoreductase n=1 Tax=Aquibium pacificus TaxID=3153579 RepID=A0ABV3SUG8_9HYPH